MEKIGKVYVDSAVLKAMKASIAMAEPVLLVGETGTGKTTLIDELAKQAGKRLVRFSINGTTSIEEIIGKWLVKDGTTFWQDGVLVRAMKHGDWVVFDELNMALSEILSALHPVLDEAKAVKLVEKNGEVVEASDGFQFFGAINPSEDYAGTKDMNTALQSRFQAVFNIEVMPPDVETRVLVEQADMDEKRAQKFVNLACELRQAKQEGKIYKYVSTRDILHAGKLNKKGVTISDAIKFAVLNKMSADEYLEVKSIVKSCIDLKEDEQVKWSEVIKQAEKDKEALAKKDKEISDLKDKIVKLSEDIIKKMQ